MRIHANAKINWSLDITGQREDGYHLMDMLMQPVSLSDDVFVHPAQTITLTTGGEPLLPADEHHLAMRAAKALQAHAGCPHGAAIHVEKHIPVGAGMGGGSADAAAVLIGLNHLWGLGLSGEALEAIGLTLGADVPFCIRGGLTRTTGIGECMQALPCARTYPFVVVQPCEGLSTREIFTAWHAQPDADKPDNASAALALAQGNAAALSASMGNVMQPISVRRRPGIDEALHALTAQGAFAAQMTGSGSAVFGAFADEASADAAFAAISARWERTFRCETTMESVVLVDED